MATVGEDASVSLRADSGEGRGGGGNSSSSLGSAVAIVQCKDIKITGNLKTDRQISETTAFNLTTTAVFFSDDHIWKKMLVGVLRNADIDSICASYPWQRSKLHVLAVIWHQNQTTSALLGE